MPRLRVVRFWVAAAAIVSVVGSLVAAAASADAPAPSKFRIRTLVKDLENPTSFAFTPDRRIFILEKAGVVKVFDHGRLDEFADLRDAINNVDDRGLLGIALDPDFKRNGWIYLAYTAELDRRHPDSLKPLRPASGAVIRLRARRDNPDLADLRSEQTLLQHLPTPGAWHSIGDIAFDAKGRLIVGMGDGSPYWPHDLNPATGGASALDAQNLDSPNGKLLRVDRNTGRGVADNPFYVSANPNAVRSKVLAFGLRNPFRFSVDPRSGDVWIGDPGSDAWEELDRVPASWSRDSATRELDFGWPCYEGGPDGKLLRQSAMVNVAACRRRFYQQATPAAVAPEYAYHMNGSAIIAGPVLEGGGVPKQLRGGVLFGDFVHSNVLVFRDGAVTALGQPSWWQSPVRFGIAPNGAITWVTFFTGQLREAIYQAPPSDSTGGSWIWAAAGGTGAAAALLGLAIVAIRRARRAT
jgi:glucose/arabinose dehydrogenase